MQSVLKVKNLNIEEIKTSESEMAAGYRLHKRIGHGTYGEVYLADYRPQVVVKKYKEMPTEKDLIELRIMQEIDSKYLCKLIDSFKTPKDEFMLVEELAKFGDLHKYCTEHL